MKRRRMVQRPLFAAPEHQAASAAFMMRFTPADLQRIRERAAQIGISASAWVRLACAHALAFNIAFESKKRKVND